MFNRWPHIRVQWDPQKVKAKTNDLVRSLRAGEPSVAVLATREGLDIGVITLKPGEDRVVARRLREAFKSAA